MSQCTCDQSYICAECQRKIDTESRVVTMGEDISLIKDELVCVKADLAHILRLIKLMGPREPHDG